MGSRLRDLDAAVMLSAWVDLLQETLFSAPLSSSFSASASLFPAIVSQILDMVSSKWVRLDRVSSRRPGGGGGGGDVGGGGGGDVGGRGIAAGLFIANISVLSRFFIDLPLGLWPNFCDCPGNFSQVSSASADFP